ncbi:MAG: ATP-grasp domain-containing protein [Candidatus Sericytochromatia bacterium]
MARVLFTGGRSPATLALLRLFARAGHDCQVAESQSANLAGASRYCRANHRVARPRQETAHFIADLQHLIRNQRIELLIPTCEESFYVARYRRELEQAGCEVFCAGSDVMANLHSKYQFNQLLQALKLPAPATQRLEDSARLKALLPEWGQWVLKPEFSRFGDEVLINAPLETVYQRVHPSPRRPWVLQEFLDGPQLCSYSVARNGRLVAHGVYPTVYTAGQGATLYFQAVDVPEIERSVKALVHSLDYTGQISFDFILHKGLYYPIECNPRTTTGTFLFSPGENLPRAFFETPERLIRPLARQPVALMLPMLLYALPADLSQSPRLLRDLWAARDPLFALDDFGPWLTQFPQIWQTLLTARRDGLSLLAASTADIEWNGFWS